LRSRPIPVPGWVHISMFPRPDLDQVSFLVRIRDISPISMMQFFCNRPSGSRIRDSWVPGWISTSSLLQPISTLDCLPTRIAAVYGSIDRIIYGTPISIMHPNSAIGFAYEVGVTALHHKVVDRNAIHVTMPSQ